jgi:hypothetical protein
VHNKHLKICHFALNVFYFSCDYGLNMQPQALNLVSKQSPCNYLQNESTQLLIPVVTLD